MDVSVGCGQSVRPEGWKLGPWGWQPGQVGALAPVALLGGGRRLGDDAHAGAAAADTAAAGGAESAAPAAATIAKAAAVAASTHAQAAAPAVA